MEVNCLDGTQLDMSRSTTTASECLDSELKTGSLTTPQYSAISEHSTVRGTPSDIGVWLTLLAVDSPVNPSALPESNWGGADERNMWPEARECIRIVQPRFALLENVPGLLSSGYFGTVLGELSEIGYDARWRVLSAAEVGAPHKRERLWILAYSERLEWAKGSGREGIPSKQQKAIGQEFRNVCEILPHPSSAGCKELHTANISGLPGHFAGSTSQKRRGTWWSTEPELGRVANGVAHRVDRLKAIGNGQVPAVVRAVWEILSQGII